MSWGATIVKPRSICKEQASAQKSARGQRSSIIKFAYYLHLLNSVLDVAIHTVITACTSILTIGN